MRKKTKELLRKVNLLKMDKGDLVNHIIELEKFIENPVKYKLIELDQTKVYYCYVKSDSQEDLIKFQNIINSTKARIKWTVPEIIISNQELKELKSDELNDLLEKTKEV